MSLAAIQDLAAAPGLWRGLAAALLVALAALWWPSGARREGLGRNRAGGGGRARWRRGRALRRGAPPALDVGEAAATCELIALALSCGAGVNEALAEVAESSGPTVRADLAALVAARRWGVAPVFDAGGEQAWGPLVRALALADAAGVPPAGTIARVAQDLRERRRHRLEIVTARLRVQVVLPLGVCFLPAFVLTTVVPVVLALAGRVGSP